MLFVQQKREERQKYLHDNADSLGARSALESRNWMLYSCFWNWRYLARGHSLREERQQKTRELVFRQSNAILPGNERVPASASRTGSPFVSPSSSSRHTSRSASRSAASRSSSSNNNNPPPWKRQADSRLQARPRTARAHSPSPSSSLAPPSPSSPASASCGGARAGGRGADEGPATPASFHHRRPVQLSPAAGGRRIASPSPSPPGGRRVLARRAPPLTGGRRIVSPAPSPPAGQRLLSPSPRAAGTPAVHAACASPGGGWGQSLQARATSASPRGRGQPPGQAQQAGIGSSFQHVRSAYSQPPSATPAPRPRSSVPAAATTAWSEACKRAASASPANREDREQMAQQLRWCNLANLANSNTPRSSDKRPALALKQSGLV